MLPDPTRRFPATQIQGSPAGEARDATLRTAGALVAAGFATSARIGALEAIANRYAIAVTPAIAALIDRNDPHDPIAAQFIPSEEEFLTTPDELADPIGDAAHSPVKGIVHRYPDRALLKPLHACPVYCRFCFRREQVGPGGDALNDAELASALDYIRANPAIWEVILTGGDPLMLSPRRLGFILDALEAIPHVATLRIHSRVPIADPARVSDALLSVLTRRKPLWLAIHANHPRELSADVGELCLRLARAGIMLLGQTVLLRGVNADAAVLEALFRAMIAARIKPYYLHHPDLAAGTSRFRLSIAEGQAIVKALRFRLSGLAHPTYVLDIPGGAGKVPVSPSWLERDGVRDPSGRLHEYPARMQDWGD
jgi:lysine 2,3-aminomutase